MDSIGSTSNEGRHTFVMDNDLEESSILVTGFEFFDDECHMMYNFSLPSLVIGAQLAGQR